MTWQTVLSAFALMLIFEGLGPALFPNKWRATMLQLAATPKGMLKKIGVVLIVLGALLFHVIQSL
ncbi:DUF2065 domain-containing protein [Pseudoalteromonas sp. SSDWG2]|uniref:DUF2065 domain-containing protein n=1 Tax=Pseudoalteromonas sp. SSDWG2 TaxID=3139391 RepID=UPI003BAB46B6